MMHGVFNPDIFRRVIEQILSERDENVEVKLTIILKEEAEKEEKKTEGPNLSSLMNHNR
jgi:hypothetical protein